MLKLLSAHTFEIDDAEAAAAEISAQLKESGGFLKNSVGLLSCHADFLVSGAVKAICAALPFDVIGITTMASSVGYGSAGVRPEAGQGATESGLDMLVLSVLTSDEMSFATVLTDALAAEQEAAVGTACKAAQAMLSGAPSLIIAHAPMINTVGGERLVRVLDKAVPGVPVFGTLPCDHNFDFSEAQVIFNGEAYRDRMAMVFMSGPLKARFISISIPEKQQSRQKALITDSSGNVIKEVDGKPVLEYLSSIGLSRESGLAGSKNIPVLLDYNDGTQAVARCFYMISPEGYAVCGGDMPVDATFRISSMEHDDVLTSAGEFLEKVIKNDTNVTCMLMLSCIVRGVVLGRDQLAEARKVGEKMTGHMPYHLMYSGGEICPVYSGGDNTANRFHNFSITACLFE